MFNLWFMFSNVEPNAMFNLLFVFSVCQWRMMIRGNKFSKDLKISRLLITPYIYYTLQGGKFSISQSNCNSFFIKRLNMKSLLSCNPSFWRILVNSRIINFLNNTNIDIFLNKCLLDFKKNWDHIHYSSTFNKGRVNSSISRSFLSLYKLNQVKSSLRS
jgi:hypothetical protein